MRRNKSLPGKLSPYNSSLSSGRKLPALVTPECLEYKSAKSMTQELTSILSKAKGTSSARALKSSVPLLSSSSTPRVAYRVGSHSTKALRGLTDTPMSKGAFVFPKEDAPRSSTPWVQSLAKETESPRLRVDTESTSRPGTSRQTTGQGQLKPRKLRLLMQGRKERNSDAVGKVLFKKTSRLEKKPVKTQLASVVTRVPLSSAERQARITPSVPEDLQGKRERIYREHLHQTFHALKVFKKLPPPDPIKLKQKQLSLTMRPGHAGKKTMIFDLDETLIHCSDDLETSAVVLPIRFPTGEVISVRCR